MHVFKYVRACAHVCRVCACARVCSVQLPLFLKASAFLKPVCSEGSLGLASPAGGARSDPRRAGGSVAAGRQPLGRVAEPGEAGLGSWRPGPRAGRGSSTGCQPAPARPLASALQPRARSRLLSPGPLTFTPVRDRGVALAVQPNRPARRSSS